MLAFILALVGSFSAVLGPSVPMGHAPAPTDSSTGYCVDGACTYVGGTRHDGVVCDPYCAESPDHSTICTFTFCYSQADGPHK